MIIASPRIAVRPRPFQFRLATLLVAMAWAGLVSLGLRVPTPFCAGVVAILTMLIVLTAVLVAIYRTDTTRAMAIGFVIFGAGYIAYMTILSPRFNSSFDGESIFLLLFHTIHPTDEVPLYIGGTMISPPPFHADDFVSISNHALATIIGIAGAIAAQVLHATRKSEWPQDN